MRMLIVSCYRSSFPAVSTLSPYGNDDILKSITNAIVDKWIRAQVRGVKRIVRWLI